MAASRLQFNRHRQMAETLDPSAGFFGDVQPANRIFRLIFDQPQISRPITASIFSGGFSAYFSLFRN